MKSFSTKKKKIPCCFYMMVISCPQVTNIHAVSFDCCGDELAWYACLWCKYTKLLSAYLTHTTLIDLTFIIRFRFSHRRVCIICNNSPYTSLKKNILKMYDKTIIQRGFCKIIFEETQLAKFIIVIIVVIGSHRN